MNQEAESREAEPRRALTAMNIAFVACAVMAMVFGIGKATHLLDPLVARRGAGAMIGLMLVVAGNFVPKLRLFHPATGTAQSDAIDRFAGWTFVVCGFAFAAVFALAPADLVFIIPPAIGLTGFFAVLVRWLMWKGRQPGRLAPRLTPGRYVMMVMLATMPWTCAIFLADVIWGDAASFWMGIAFIAALLTSAALFVAKCARSPHA